MKSWDVVSDVLKLLVSNVKPGITTQELNDIGEKRVIELGAIPINKGYHPKWANSPFPAAVCISVNDEIAHGIPSERKLENGDTIILDIGVKKDGICGDAALTVGVGEISNRDDRLLRHAKMTLEEGIRHIRPGVKLKELARLMQTFALQRGYIINYRFCGHFIGKEMHEEPMIPHVTWPGLGEQELKVGDMFCLEPILTYKDKFGVPVNDWVVKTTDGKKAAMFESQILVTDDGCQVLTTHI